MLLIPGAGDSRTVTNTGSVGSVVPGAAVPEGASVNVYGATTEILSAANNTQESWGIHILHTAATSPAAALAGGTLDILVGTDTLVSSLIVGGSFACSTRSYFFPVRIPAGVALSARFASEMAHTTDAEVAIHLHSGGTPPFRVGSKVTTYGTKTNDARGQIVTVTAGGGAAASTTLAASSAEDHFYWLPGFQAQNDSAVTPVSAVNVGIGIGSQRIGTWWFSKTTEERQSGPWPDLGVFKVAPAGSQVNMLCSNGGANDAQYGGLIYAVS